MEPMPAAYRKCRDDDGIAEEWVIEEGLLTGDQVKEVLENLRDNEGDGRVFHLNCEKSASSKSSGN